MTTLDVTPSLDHEPVAPARASLRSSTVHRLGAYTTVRLATGGSAPTTVFVAGDIDLACADELAAILCAALDANPAGIELDLAAVHFFDCRGLRALMIARAFARRHRRHFALGAHSEVVARLLELTDNRSLLTTPR